MAIPPTPGIGPGASALRAPGAAQPSLPSLPSLPEGDGAGRDDFGALFAAALENLQALQARSDRLAIDAATGRLTDVHDYMIAATEASLATELTVAVRNRAVDAFNQIMQMGV